MFRNYFLLRLTLSGSLSILFFSLGAQETNSRASGRVFSENNEIPAGVTITLIHDPTQNPYFAVTRHDGYFDFFNLKPGGPYSLIINSAGYETLKKNNLFISLSGEHFFEGNTEISNFHLQKKIVTLDEVIIDTRNINRNKNGIETIITGAALRSMPTISRSFHDIVRMVPQAKVNGEGAMSLAGQNNRFNAFFIDGANNNDIQGLALSGMNGGQTGAPPVSIEAIEEINISLAPYDVQFGNFTGGSINAITRSGSNENKTSAWYYFRNEHMAGRSPQALEKQGFPGEFHRPRLSSFFNQTFGTWNSGALVKNKAFYFVLFERQSELRPQPFDISLYQGNSTEQQLLGLNGFLRNNYLYDSGSFLESKDELDAIRMNIKFDWNASVKNKFMLSYRYNNAERAFPVNSGSRTAVRFQNNGVTIPSSTHTASFEWKHFLKTNMNNRFLVTFTNQAEDRQWIGQPFPNVTIEDGSRSSITLGSDLATGLYDLKAKDFTLFNVFKYIKDKHVLTIGTDINYTILDNIYIGGTFGSYRFGSLADFMNGVPPTSFFRSFLYSDDLADQTKYQTLRSSFFINDEIRPGENLKLNFGIRLDVNSILSKPAADQFFNDRAIHIISQYYDLAGARSGQTMKPHWALSPRIAADYKFQRYDLNVKAGAGIFLGHSVNLWSSDVFNSVSGSIELPNPQQFIPDPYNQPTPQSLNLNPADYKGNLRLMSKHFKYPSVFRTSIAAEKRIKNNWTFSIEGIFTKNIHEAAFRNVNIVPPAFTSDMPNSRNVYSTGSQASKIDLSNNNVKNPYTNIFLLTNNHEKRGNSYSLSFIIQKQARNFSFNSSYTYGRSRLLTEITGPQTPVAAQWRNMETVNGRNFVTLSVSDNDLKHRATAWISKKMNYAKNKAATSISLFYNGQSGSPYSYVYEKSMINDESVAQNFDLIYIPTTNELASMNFIPILANNTILYTAQEQKEFLNAFIDSEKYLKKHRGEFSKRNGARLPFSHVIDLRLQQDFIIKIGRKNFGLTITYDVFNFTNMLNRDWGHTWLLTNDSYPLIQFAGWADPATLKPKYQFKPVTGKHYTLQTSTLPGNSARWISQLGLKINLD